MKSPTIGRNLAIIIVFAFVAWGAVRSIGARPPAAPNGSMPKPTLDTSLAAKKGKESVVFAGGCFWGVQAVFQHVKGVRSATSGYSGGYVKDPGYETVSSGVTGHAESVSVTYDPSQISFGQLLMVFFSVVHDPTQLNRQGPDTGSQYRSAIFYSTDEQKRIVDAYISQLEAAKVYDRKIVTEVTPFKAFYRAEEYHQDYLKNHPNNPYIMQNDLPKLENLKKDFPSLYKAD